VLREIKPRRGGTLAAIQEIWPDLAGAETAARTRLVSLQGGVLTVEVTSAALKHHLSTFRSEELLAGLRERLPDTPVRALRCRPGDTS
jgi:predicted nucleic acid-binding Zn ribbon protein